MHKLPLRFKAVKIIPFVGIEPVIRHAYFLAVFFLFPSSAMAAEYPCLINDEGYGSIARVNPVPGQGTAVACGAKNTASFSGVGTGAGNTAVGVDNTVRGAGYSSAYGAENEIQGTSSSTFGHENKLVANGSTAIGAKNEIYAAEGTAIGFGNLVFNRYSTAIGSNNAVDIQLPDSFANGHGVAIGYNNDVYGPRGIAIGDGAEFGTYLSTTPPTDGLAMGTSSRAKATNSIAIGTNAYAGTENSVALGSNSETATAHVGAYSVNGGAIAATTSAGGTISVGKVGLERQVQNVAAGVVSATSTDAVNGSQLYAVGSQVNSATLQVTSSGQTTAAALGGGSTYTSSSGVSAPSYAVRGSMYNNVGSAIGAINTQLGIYDNQIGGLNNAIGALGAGLVSTNQRVEGLDRKASQGIAMAAAMAQAPMPSAPGKTSWKFNNSVYRNAAATSLSIAHRLPTRVPVAVTGGVAIGLRNSAIVTGGLQGEF